MAFQRRLLTLFLLSCAGAAVVWLRVVELQVFQGDYWRSQARSARLLDRRITPPRGRILDRNGSVIVRDEPIPRLAFVGEEWLSRDRLECSACGAIRFTRDAERARNRRCRCGAKGASFVPLGPGDLSPLETVLHLPPGRLAELAQQRLSEVRDLLVRYREALEHEDLPEFLVRDEVERYGRQLLNFEKIVLPDRPLDREALRLLELDEDGRFRGFSARYVPRRVVEGAAVPGQLLGYVSAVQPNELPRLRREYGRDVDFTSRIGRLGIERAYQDVLLGKSGEELLARDEHGVFTRIVKERRPERGTELTLGLTIEACAKAHEILEAHGKRGNYHPRALPSAGFVAMEARTGRIVAWAELPAFDVSEDLGRVFDPEVAEAEQRARYDAAEGAWVLPDDVPLPDDETLETFRARLSKPAPRMLSRVSQIAVEPGSTMKVFVGLGLLDGLERVAPGAPLPLARDHATYSCRAMKGLPGCHDHSPVDFVGALEVSCNRYFALSLRWFPDYWRVYRTSVPALLGRLGFGRPTGVDVAYEHGGQLLRDWVDFDPRAPLAAAAEAVERDAGLEVTFRPEAALPGLVAGRDPARLTGAVAGALTTMAKALAAREALVSVGPAGSDGRWRDVRVLLGFRTHPDGPAVDTEALSVARRRLETALSPFGGSRVIEDAPGIPGAWTFAFRLRYHEPIGRASFHDPLPILPDDGTNVGIGQGPLTVTPLQMVRAVAAIANGGHLVTPRVVERADGVAYPPRSIDLHLDPSDLARVREGMRRVVGGSRGTARNAGFETVPATVYGKTGTSQTSGYWHRPGRSGSGPWHEWFVGFAVPPRGEPLAFACVFHAREERAASRTAAPAVAEFLQWWYREGPEAR